MCREVRIPAEQRTLSLQRELAEWLGVEVAMLPTYSEHSRIGADFCLCHVDLEGALTAAGKAWEVEIEGNLRITVR